MGVLRQILEEIFLKSINNISQGSITTVPSASLTTIVTINATQTHKIVDISCSGNGYAKYNIYKNTILIDSKISSPGYAINFKFDYPLALSTGEILDVKVEHFFSGQQLSFDATIYSII